MVLLVFMFCSATKLLAFCRFDALRFWAKIQHCPSISDPIAEKPK